MIRPGRPESHVHHEDVTVAPAVAPGLGCCAFLAIARCHDPGALRRHGRGRQARAPSRVCVHPERGDHAELDPDGDRHGFRAQSDPQAARAGARSCRGTERACQQRSRKSCDLECVMDDRCGPEEIGTDLDGRVTVDQIAAQHLGQYTQLASLELGLESPDFAGECDGGYSCAYTHTVSWRDATTPLPVETNPRIAFERIFGDGDSTNSRVRSVQLEQDRSILDGVTRDAAHLQKALGPGDRQKLTQDPRCDTRRRAADPDGREAECRGPAATIAATGGRARTLRRSREVDVRSRRPAYQCDLTRVITLMMGKEVSNRSYPEIGVPERTTPHRTIRTTG